MATEQDFQKYLKIVKSLIDSKESLHFREPVDYKGVALAYPSAEPSRLSDCRQRADGSRYH